MLLTDHRVGPVLAAHYGADGYVAKPVDIEDLLATVERLVGRA